MIKNVNNFCYLIFFLCLVNFLKDYLYQLIFVQRFEVFYFFFQVLRIFVLLLKYLYEVFFNFFFLFIKYFILKTNLLKKVNFKTNQAMFEFLKLNLINLIMIFSYCVPKFLYIIVSFISFFIYRICKTILLTEIYYSGFYHNKYEHNKNHSYHK